ncbi:MAG: hypothetical protein IKS49_06130 [Actinomycetaceae bacterium]|nr:hypothetical protein [Actinomycetaceae bacterium]
METRMSVGSGQVKQAKPKKKFSRGKVAALGVALGLALSLSFTACSLVKSKMQPRQQESTISETTTPTPQEQLSPPEDLDTQVSRIVGEMTVEEKVAQLFFVTPESLTGMGQVIAAGETTKKAYNTMPVGGIIYFELNLNDTEQTQTMLSATQEYATERTGIPVFLAVDEEGGTVTRVGGHSGFTAKDPGNMRAIGDTGDTNQARETARTIGTYLADLGFNVDFAPVADIANSSSTTMSKRSFGSTSQAVSPMVAAQIEGFSEAGVLCSAKHFPGIGGAYGDSHTGAISSSKTIEQMKTEELQPFYTAIDAGVPFIMVGHLTVQQATGSQLPASLNPVMMSELLREDMGYEGLIITDSLGMGAVTQFYNPNEVGLQAVLAGADMILMPTNLQASYETVLAAVRDGRLSEERLDESVHRIVRTKVEMKQ